MAKRKASGTKTRTVYRTAPRKRKGRRSSTLNRSVKKPMQTVGTLIGLTSVYGVPLWNSITTMKATPILGAVMNKDYAIAAAKNVAVGYLGGTAAGIVADKTGLKKPINKALRTVRGII